MQGIPPGFEWPMGFRFPAWALPTWSPLWAGTLKWNVQASEGFGTIASEWQNFVSARLREDFALMQRVAHSRTPDQVWAAYAKFWQTAVEDYGREYLMIGRHMAKVMSESVTAAQSIAGETGAGAFRASRIG
jgi:hypothetical protein